MDATTVATRLRRSTPTHHAYTVRVANRRVAALVTAHPADARRWVHTTRWLNLAHLRYGRLLVGLGVQWTPTRRPLHGAPPPPATLQLCVGHRCLVFHLAQADAVPDALHRFLADPRVTFVGSGNRSDRRMLRDHYGLHVASGRELRTLAGMGNASMEHMADRFLGYPGIKKPKNVAMSAWHVLQLSPEQVEYACVDAYLAFRIGVHVWPPAQRAPVLVRTPPPARRPVPIRAAPPAVHAPQPHWALLTVVVDAAGSSSKITDARQGVTGSSDTETEYGGEVGETGNLSVAHSSFISNDDDFSSDGFELVGCGSVTDEEEEEDGYEDCAVGGIEILSDDVEEEEGYKEYTGIGIPTVDDHQEEGYKEYTGIGILTVDNDEEAGDEEFIGNGAATVHIEELEEEEGVQQGGCQASEHFVTVPATANVEEGGGDGGYQAFEYYGNSEAFGGVEDEGYYGQDDWYDQGDYGYDQDGGGYEEFY